jgi:hypothetical protein
MAWKIQASKQAQKADKLLWHLIRVILITKARYHSNGLSLFQNENKLQLNLEHRANKNPSVSLTATVHEE